jgi:hypothetical protein
MFGMELRRQLLGKNVKFQPTGIPTHKKRGGFEHRGNKQHEAWVSSSMVFSHGRQIPQLDLLETFMELTTSFKIFPSALGASPQTLLRKNAGFCHHKTMVCMPNEDHEQPHFINGKHDPIKRLTGELKAIRHWTYWWRPGDRKQQKNMAI